jgi:hypothetical protein
MLAAWAVPVFAVAAVAAMEMLDRRKGAIQVRERPSAQRRSGTTATAQSRSGARVRFTEWPRSLVSDPDLRARLVNIARVAADLAGKAAKVPKRAKSHWWR